MVIVEMFPGIWYLKLEVSTKIHLLCSFCDDAGHVYWSFLLFHALLAGFPCDILLILSALHKTQGHILKIIPQANTAIFVLLAP